jgi:hypothetical protein
VDDNTKLLEDRVRRAAVRIRELASERRRLESELLALRERLEGMESGGSAPTGSNDDFRRWPVQRMDVVATLRETIEQLTD